MLKDYYFFDFDVRVVYNVDFDVFIFYYLAISASISKRILSIVDSSYVVFQNLVEAFTLLLILSR